MGAWLAMTALHWLYNLSWSQSQNRKLPAMIRWLARLKPMSIMGALKAYMNPNIISRLLENLQKLQEQGNTEEAAKVEAVLQSYQTRLQAVPKTDLEYQRAQESLQKIMAAEVRPKDVVAASHRGRLPGNDKQAVGTRQIGGPIEGATHWVRSVAFDPTGNFMLTGSDDRKARLYQLNKDKDGNLIITQDANGKETAWVQIGGPIEAQLTGSGPWRLMLRGISC
jgi:glucose/arabinose dehydrogenase